MKKSMYSLMLADEIVHQIDMLAKSQNTNRSSLINEILAEHVNCVTPQKRVNSIYELIEKFFDNNDAFRSFLEPNDSILCLKSSLDYKYRPTIKYDVQIYKNSELGTIGELRVMFRTQSSILLSKLNDFFELFIKIEKDNLENIYPNDFVGYTLENGRFVRIFKVPEMFKYSDDTLADAISNYIKCFDIMLKNFLNNHYISVNDFKNRYYDYFTDGELLI